MAEVYPISTPPLKRKKRQQSRSADLKSVCLYLDDLKELEAIFKDGPKRLEIEVDDYEAVSEVETLVGLENLKSLSFSASEPYVSLDMNDYWVRLRIHDEDDAIALRTFDRVRRFLESRRPPVLVRFGHSFVGYMIFGQLIAQAVTQIIFWTFSRTMLLSALSVFWAVLAVMFVFVPHKMRLGRKARVFLEDRRTVQRSRKHFWNEETKTLRTVVITVIATLLLAWIAGQLGIKLP